MMKKKKKKKQSDAAKTDREMAFRGSWRQKIERVWGLEKSNLTERKHRAIQLLLLLLLLE